MTDRQEYIPSKYGVEAVKFLLTRPCGGLLLPVGFGKTGISLFSVMIMINTNLINRVLVVCPIRAIRNVWMAEMNKWEEFETLSAVDLRQDINAPMANIELCSPSILEKVLNSRRAEWDLLIIDESTDFKNSATQRFKLLRKHLRRFKYRWLLTGSPAPNSLLDLWAPTFILDEGAALGKYITHYRTTYFESDRMGWNWTVRPGCEPLIHERVRNLYYRVDAKTGGIELPELRPNRITVELPESARRHYKQMEEEFFTIVENEGIASPNAGAAGVRLRQIANGHIYLPEDSGAPRRTATMHTEKIAALKELVAEQSGQPLLVFYEFNADADAIMRAIPTAKNLSRSSDDFAELWIREFNAGHIPVLLGQQSGVSKALNLQKACAAVCFYSPPWSLLNYEQGIGRVVRQGNPNETVVVHHIVASNTRDERAESVLADRAATQGRLNTALSAR